MKNGIVITIVIIALVIIASAGYIFMKQAKSGASDSTNEDGTPDTSGSGIDSGTGSGTNSEAGPETQQPLGDTGTKTYNVDISGFKFSPQTLNIKVGDTVVWTNKDGIRHTVTSDSGSELASVYLSQGETYLHTFTRAGTYPYHCTPHPGMKGTIIVS